MRALGSQVFAGGFTLGVHKAGFEVVAQLETSGYGAAVARYNLPKFGIEAPVLEGDPAGSYKALGKIDFLYANPPCAAFSPLGDHPQYTEHPGWPCHQAVHALVERTNPTIWCIESVPAITTAGRFYVQWLSNFAHQRGYASTLLFEDGRFTGLPQRRRRVFLVFHKVAFHPRPPTGNVVSVREALEPVTDRGHEWPMFEDWLPILRTLKPGDRVRSPFLAMHPQPVVHRRPRLEDVVLNPDLPSTTFLGHVPPCLIYPPTPPDADGFGKEGFRFLGLNEIRALCGYPEGYTFGTSHNRAGDLMARAVLPPPAAYLAGEVRHALEEELPLTADAVGPWEVPHAYEYWGKTKALSDNTIVPKQYLWFPGL